MSNRSILIQSAKDMFLKYGIKSVSMDDIARLIGISKKTIYNHVTNKKDLVSNVMEVFIEEEQKVVKQITEEAKNAVDEMTSIARHVLRSLRLMKPSLTYDLKKYHPNAWRKVEDNHFSFMEGTIRQNLLRGIDEGFYRDNFNAKIVSKIYLSMALNSMNDEIFSHNDFRLSEIYENFILYHLNGIINDKGRKELAKYLNRTSE